MVSSFGYFLSLLQVLFFIMLIWEGWVSKLSNQSMYYSSSLEWINNVPPLDHTFQLNMLIK